MLVRLWSDRNSRSELVEMQNAAATSEDSLVISYKIKYDLTIQSNNHALWYLPKGVENFHR